MTRWELLTDEQAQSCWDETLTSFEDCSPFQSFAWGEYRRGLGWEIYRFAAFDDGNAIVAMFQAYVRRHRFGFGLLWSEGGPVGDLSICDTSLQTAISQAVGLKRLYCRFRCDRPRTIEHVLRLNANGWQIPWAMLASNFTAVLDLTPEEKDLLSEAARNWRGNVRRVEKDGINAQHWVEPRADEIIAVFRSMEQVKGLEEQHSRQEIEQLLAKVGSQLALYRCSDEQGRILSLGGVLISGRCANLWLLATTEEGRKRRASYAVFWALIQHCRRVGVRSYDLGGVDPVANYGVYRFKKDCGAPTVELLGEWDWAPKPWVRWLGNLAIAQRSRVRRAETALKKSHSLKQSAKPAEPATEVNTHPVTTTDPLVAAETN